MDDAQWADAQSLALIHDLIRSAPSARLLVAAAARREELDEHQPLTTLTTALAALGRLPSRADPAQPRGHRAAGRSRHRRAARSAGLGRLYADSEGNPLFLVEALRPDAPATASMVQAVIAGRLTRLSPEAAAIAGSPRPSGGRSPRTCWPPRPA